jgi:polar amino acid transport system substrate-binding protein
MRWTQAISSVREGRVLGVVGPYFHAYDLSMMYPYSYPLAQETLVTVCRKDGLDLKANEATWPEDYAGLKMGNIAGFTGWSSKALKLRDANKMNFFEFPDVLVALRGVDMGTVDCSVFEQNLFVYYQNNPDKKYLNAELDNLQIVNQLNHQTSHVGYSQVFLNSNPDRSIQAFPQRFDAALIQLKRDGSLDAIYEKYQGLYPLSN